MKELTMAELSAGVRALVGRMESNPSEFYGNADKWHFMFSANFRDVLTEPEKGALHEALKEVRRKEFDEKVMRELLKDNVENQIKEGYYTSPQIGSGGTGFGRAIIKGEGSAVGYDTALSNPHTSLVLGKETLNEADIKRFKEATTSPSLFK
jgi:hypothetical protein